MSKRAAIYAYKDASGYSLSVEKQIEKCREHIRKAGMSISDGHVFVDEAGSGPERSDFRQMVELGSKKEHPFDVIVCYATSNFSCDQDEARLYKTMLRRNGVDVEFVSTPIREGHIGQLTERALEWRDAMNALWMREQGRLQEREVS